MTGSQITVNHSAVAETGTVLQGKRAGLDQKANELVEAASELSGAWEGSAANSYMGALDSILLAHHETIAAMGTLSSRLVSADSRFSEADSRLAGGLAQGGS